MYDYEHRKSRTRITVTDQEGRIMPGREVKLDLVRHEFLFGTGAFFLVNRQFAAPENQAYYEKVWESWQHLFNYATLPFYLGSYEPEQGKPTEAPTLVAARILSEAGRRVKGHPLCWHTACADWLMKYTDEEVLDFFKYRIRRELNAFHEAIRFWDVINEVVIMPEFDRYDNAVTRLCRKMGRVPLVKALFDTAREADPTAKLLINDFNTGVRYAELIRGCLDAGAGIDMIGIQSHQHQGFWGMEKLQEVTERFEAFGLPIHYTENTFVSGHLMDPDIVDLNDYQIPDWPSTPEGEERQAVDLLTMLDYLFSRPQVEAFTCWDFEDAQWLGAPSGLIRKDGSRKPAYEALEQRLLKDWHTAVRVMTDENGECTLEGFRGEYEAVCDRMKGRFTLNKDNDRIMIRMK